MSTASTIQNYDFYSSADLSRYAGEWVAIIGRKVTGHEKDIKELLKKVKKNYPSVVPFVVKVPTKEIMLW